MSDRKQGLVIVALLAITTGMAGAVQAAQKSVKSKPAAGAGHETVLVVVNGDKITEADLIRAMMTRQVREEDREKYKGPFLEEMIDARLIKQFLKSRKTAATKQEIDEQVNRLREAARRGDADPDKVLAEKGYTPESLREEFALPLAWKHHIERAITAARLKRYFQEHRPEFDGTKVRASQIFLKVPASDAGGRKAAEASLASLRKQIVDGQVSFEDAAREHSQSPSKADGGDVGWFPYSGKMPGQISQEAFRLKVGEISPVFTTRFGVHLLLVTDRKQGDLSLEDVRDDVLARMSQELWKEMAADMRKSAKIEWKIDRPSAAGT